MLHKIIIFSILIFEILLLVTGELPSYYDSFFLYLILFFNFVSIFSYILIDEEKNVNLKDNKLKFTTLFLIAFLIVGFQPFIDLALGFLEPTNTYLFINSSLILKLSIYCSISLNSYLLGVSLYKGKEIIKKVSDKNKKVNIRFLKILNALAFFLFLSLIDSSFLDSTKYGAGKRELSPLLGYAMLLFDTSFIAIILHIILNNGYKSSILKYLNQFGYNIIFYFVYLLMIMMSGDRGPIIYMGLALIFGYIYLNNYKISKLRLIGVIGFFTFFITILGIIRKTDGTFNTAINYSNENKYYPDSFFPGTKELATSVLTISTAIDKIPSSFGYTNGLFMAQNFSVLVPGLNSFITSQFGIDYNLTSSGRLLTYLHLGPNASWGVGTSAVADVYIDFGLLGLIFVFILFGYLMRRLEYNVLGLKSDKFTSVAIYLLFFSFSIYIARSSLIVPFTKFAYVALFYYSIYLFQKRK